MKAKLCTEKKCFDEFFGIYNYTRGRVEFPPTSVGDKRSHYVTLSNPSDRTVTLILTSKVDNFVVYPHKLILKPHAKRDIEIVFAPKDRGTWLGDIEVRDKDADTILCIRTYGQGVK